MPDKILYTGGPNPFKGLIGMPEEPVKRFDAGHYVSAEHEYLASVEEWKEQVESIKSNAPDIVNPEEVVVFGGNNVKGNNRVLTLENYNNGIGVTIKPGDIFDLPKGYEFKKEWKACERSECLVPLTCKFKVNDVCPGKTPVLRIVKTEVKESKYDFTEVQRSIDPHGYATAAAKILDALKLVIGQDVNEFAMPVLVTIMKNHIKASVSQPEPEESQKELWEEITAIILGSEDDMEITRNKIMKQFLIQRKK